MTATVQNHGSAKRSKYLLFAFIGMVFAYVLWNNESFLINGKDPEWQHIATYRWWLLPHGLAAACALLLGPLQFSDRLRQRYAKVHRVMGRFYVAGALVGAPLGAYIQYFREGAGDTRTFTIAAGADAAVWMLTTTVAMWFILRGKVQQHRQWMTRSFACSIIFIEVRAIVGITGWDKYIETVIWCCVVAAVPLADLVLQWQDSRRGPAVSARAGEIAQQRRAAAVS